MAQPMSPGRGPKERSWKRWCAVVLACGPVQIHLGVESDFRPARKAHAALRCFDYHGLVERIRAAGVEVIPDQSIPGVERCHIADRLGIELS